MRRKAGVAAAGLALAMVVGVSGAAVANAPDPVKSPKPGTSGPKKAGDKGKADWLADLAKRYGVTKDRLENALRDVKIALGAQPKGPVDPAVIAKLAGALGISRAEAAKLFKEVFAQPGKQGGKGKKKEEGREVSPAVLVDALAKELKISQDRARTLVADLDALGRDHGLDPSDAKFAAIAKGLGLTAQQLTDALKAVKTSLGGAGKPDSPKPASPEPYKS